MKKATSIQQWQEEFRLLLATEIVTFYYRKKNGKLRKAVGTTCLDYVPNDFQPKGPTAPLPEGSCPATAGPRGSFPLLPSPTPSAPRGSSRPRA